MQRHPLDLLSLLFGLVFTAVAVIGLTDLLTLTVIDVRWIGPGLLVAFGVTLVLTAGRSRGEPQGAAGGLGSGRPGTGAARPTGPAGHAVGDPEGAVGDPEGPADEPAGDVAADAADGAAADPATGVAADPAHDPPEASRDG